MQHIGFKIRQIHRVTILIWKIFDIHPFHLEIQQLIFVYLSQYTTGYSIFDILIWLVDETRDGTPFRWYLIELLLSSNCKQSIHPQEYFLLQHSSLIKWPSSELSNNYLPHIISTIIINILLCTFFRPYFHGPLQNQFYQCKYLGIK